MGQGTRSKRTRASTETPIVALLHDDFVRPRQLRQALDRNGCGITDVFPNVSDEELRELRAAVDLLIIPTDSARPETIARLKALAGSDGARKIFALARPEDVSRCLELIRGAGIAGLLATNASASHMEFRFNEILDLFPERRRFERVPIVMPVEIVSADGTKSSEYGTSLSVAGIGIASRRALETNGDLRLGLALEPGSPVVEAQGRVIHCVQDHATVPPFRIGIYFQKLSPQVRRRIEMVVAAAT